MGCPSRNKFCYVQLTFYHAANNIVFAKLIKDSWIWSVWKIFSLLVLWFFFSQFLQHLAWCTLPCTKLTYLYHKYWSNFCCLMKHAPEVNWQTCLNIVVELTLTAWHRTVSSLAFGLKGLYYELGSHRNTIFKRVIWKIWS